MPSKNVSKTFIDAGYYHAYNRGVAKQDIFLDEQDYKYFLSFLKYLLTDQSNIEPRTFNVSNENLDKDIRLLSYVLMPNHFHLLVQQKYAKSMSKLIRKLSVSYAMYFNQKYQRVGSLFQGTYKAILLDSDEYLIHLSRYIHINALDLPAVNLTNLVDYKYSSYPFYLGVTKDVFVKKEQVLSHFGKETKDQINNYKDFVESYLKGDDVPEKYLFTE